MPIVQQLAERATQTVRLDDLEYRIRPLRHAVRVSRQQTLLVVLGSLGKSAAKAREDLPDDPGEMDPDQLQRFASKLSPRELEEFGKHQAAVVCEVVTAIRRVPEDDDAEPWEDIVLVETASAQNVDAKPPRLCIDALPTSHVQQLHATAMGMLGEDRARAESFRGES